MVLQPAASGSQSYPAAPPRPTSPMILPLPPSLQTLVPASATRPRAYRAVRKVRTRSHRSPTIPQQPRHRAGRRQDPPSPFALYSACARVMDASVKIGLQEPAARAANAGSSVGHSSPVSDAWKRVDWHADLPQCQAVTVANLPVGVCIPILAVVGVLSLDQAESLFEIENCAGISTPECDEVRSRHTPAACMWPLGQFPLPHHAPLCGFSASLCRARCTEA